MKAVPAFSLLLAPPGERWFGRDRLEHIFVSALVQSVTLATIEAAGAPTPERSALYCPACGRT